MAPTSTAGKAALVTKSFAALEAWLLKIASSGRGTTRPSGRTVLPSNASSRSNRLCGSATSP